MRTTRTWGNAALAVVLLLGGGCGGDDGGPGDGDEAASPAIGGQDDSGDEAKGECPFATAAQVSDVMDREMKVTLWSDTDCEWLQVDDSAVSASVGYIDPEVGFTEFNEFDGTPVDGIGDEAYESNAGLHFKVGDEGYEVLVADLNGTGVDIKTAQRELAKIAAGNVD